MSRPYHLVVIFTLILPILAVSEKLWSGTSSSGADTIIASSDGQDVFDTLVVAKELTPWELIIHKWGNWSDEEKYRVLSFFFDGVPTPIVPTSIIVEAGEAGDSLQFRTGVQSKPVTFFLHKPFKEKKCQECHEVESGNKSGKNIAALCYKCHAQFRELPGVVHGPVAIGICQSCHDPHTSKFEHLLTRSGDQVCLFCHEIEGEKTTKFHGANKEGSCLSCHDPHNSPQTYLLRNSENKL